MRRARNGLDNSHRRYAPRGASTIPWQLTRWRMQTAGTLFTEDAATVAEGVGRLGHRPETVFSPRIQAGRRCSARHPRVPDRPPTGCGHSRFRAIPELVSEVEPHLPGGSDPLPTSVPDWCARRRRDDDGGLHIGGPEPPEPDRHPVPLRRRRSRPSLARRRPPRHVEVRVHSISRDADVITHRNPAPVLVVDAAAPGCGRTAARSSTARRRAGRNQVRRRTGAASRATRTRRLARQRGATRGVGTGDARAASREVCHAECPTVYPAPRCW